MANNLTCLYSGRFDPPNTSHFITALRLTKKFKKIYIVMLDYPDRVFSIPYCYEIWKEFCKYHPKMEILVNKVHFGKITIKELKTLPKFDVYVAGNLDVIKHIYSLGIETLYVERAFEVNSTEIRLGHKVASLL